MPKTYTEEIVEKLKRYQVLTETNVFYTHWEDAQDDWDYDRWPNFTPPEPGISCPYTNNFYLDPHAFDCLQKARDIIAKPLVINSGHRSVEHNMAVGGAPSSSHLKIAFDISLDGHNRFDVRSACVVAGFTCFGLYKTHIHVDTREDGRIWYGEGAEIVWNNMS